VIGHWERPIDDAHWRVPIEEVEGRMLDLAMLYDVVEICCDPFRWQRSMEVWRSAGLPVVEFNQTPQRMVPATAALYDAVIQSRLRHAGDARLSRHIANATPQYSRHGIMLRKGRESNKKIDLAVAAIMAWSRAMTISTPPLVQPAPPVTLISL